ncbi:MAG: M61 family metallopeptidase [Neisseriaceae bacterium]|nr:M61 family metallopeptidase [Neisseriaceae bacterium]
MIAYHISPLNPHQHLLQVRVCFNNKNNELTEIYLPNWTAGSYMIRDFCRHIVSIRAICDEKAVLLQQTHKNRWTLPPMAGQFCVEYVVYAFDLSVRGAFFDTERLFFDGAAVLIGIAGRENEPCEITFRLPEHTDNIVVKIQNETRHRDADSINNTARRDNAVSFLKFNDYAMALPCENGIFKANNYPALLDAPFVANLSGSLKTLSFTACNIPHKIILTGEYEYLDEQRLTDDIQKICTQHIELFGKAPFSQYTFILHITDNEYGGLEHKNSSSLIAARRCLPNCRHQNNRDDYIVLLGLFSHEYFHAWNIKSIKPAVFEVYDLQQEVYTPQLWAYEGITSYYDDLALVKSNVISITEYLTLLLKNIDKVYQHSGRFVQSLAQSSFEAWSKYYKQNENSPNAIVSYYQKGALAALCLDLIIRQKTNHQQSLDDVMRLFFNRFLQGNGLTEDKDWQTACEKVSGSLLNDFFQNCIYGTQELPLAELLNHIGLELRFQAACNILLCDEFPKENKRLEFGAKFEDTAQGKIIKHIAHNSLAEQAGLCVSDCLVAINGCGVSEWDSVWQQIAVDDCVTIHYFRQNRLKQTQFTANAHYQQCPVMKVLDKDKVRQWLLNE